MRLNEFGNSIGEEDLSYISGDERDFNEVVFENQLQPRNDIRMLSKATSPLQQRIEALKGDH